MDGNESAGANVVQCARRETATAHEIRRFDPCDLGQVLDLSGRAWEPVFRALQRNVDGMSQGHFFPDWRHLQARAVESALTDPDMRSWVAVADEEVHGFLVARLHAPERMGELHMIAVDPPYQGQGIARALYAEGEAWIRESGMSMVMVDTGSDSSYAAARATYARLGFRELPMARFFKNLDDVT